MIKNIDLTIHHNIEDLFTVIGNQDEDVERLEAKPYSYWQSTFRQLLKSPLAIFFMVLLFVIVLMAIIGPMMRQFDIYSYGGTVTVDRPGEWCEFTTGPLIGQGAWCIDYLDNNPTGTLADIDNANKSIGYRTPDSVAWFGSAGKGMRGFQGMDLWTLVWLGTRFSLLLGLVVALINTILGLLIGAAWGFFKWLDPILLEFRNFVYNIPSLLLYILMMQFLRPSFWTIVLVLCMFGWMGLAGFMRNQIIIIRNREYNIASQTLGSSSKAIIVHNLLPYLVSIIVTVISTAIPGAIASEVSLAFFGLSFQPTSQVTLGQVLTQATNDVWNSYPYMLIAPMIVMVPMTIAFFYIGLILADATDPKNHR
ncbi:MAG TPA: ABC transporter permease [Bacilli bacterium]|nr:ABC transporter permease [Bacilli bacterium]